MSRSRPRAGRSPVSRGPRVVLVGVSLVAALLAPGLRMAAAAERISAVAVFPVENLSGGGVPADEVRQFLIGSLTSGGVRVLGDDALDEFMTRHRIRYAAGIDAATAESLKQETGVDAVMIASVELTDGTVPPKLALMVRLVSIQTVPTIVWSDDLGMAGDDAPGLLELGMVNDYQTLQTRALNRLAQSLLAYVQTGAASQTVKRSSKFRPRSFYRGRAIEPGKTYSVAVLPFFNLSQRRNAGEILSLLFMRHLSGLPQFRVLDLGVVRQELLNARIIMDGGISIADADAVASLVDADFVLAGRVLSYQDYEGPAGRTHVEFSTVLIEKKSRRVVFSSDSDNDGDDGVHFFERGTSRTAHIMATQMVRLAAEALAGGTN